MAEFPWYCARVVAHAEPQAGRFLTESGIETFVPLRIERQQICRTYRDREIGFFPGYFFVRLDLQSGAQKIILSRTPRFWSLVAVSKRPVEVAPELIEQIRGHVGDNGYMTTEGLGGFQLGALVVPAEGPYAGKLARIELWRRYDGALIAFEGSSFRMTGEYALKDLRPMVVS